MQTPWNASNYAVLETRPIREHPYAPFIDRVRKPAQYLAGEQGETRKSWEDVRCRICLAFPDLYEIGMSHLGYKILYDIVNKSPDFLAERAYVAWPDMEAELRAHGQPLCSLESARGLHEFDIVGFSLQYELTYTNVLQILELGHVPLFADERGDDDPLIVAGGPTATHADLCAELNRVAIDGIEFFGHAELGPLDLEALLQKPELAAAE